MCVNHPKILTSQKLRSSSGLFGLKGFPEFVILLERIEPIACLLFYLVIKIWENFYRTLKTVAKILKNIKKREKQQQQPKEKNTKRDK